MTAHETTGPRVHPGVVEAYQQGEQAFLHGSRNPPDWWPLGIRQAYADGYWHSQWNAEGQSAHG